MKKILFLVILILAVGIGTIAYMSVTSTDTYDGPVESLTVAVSNLEATTLVRVAEENGYFDDQGLDISYIYDDLGKFSFNRVLSSEADIATVAEFPVVKQAFERNDVRLFGTIHASNKNVRFLARSDSGIETISDMPGKRIATSKGTVGEFFLHLLLLAHGVDPAEVNIIDMSPQQIEDAILSGNIDGFALREPHVYKAEQSIQNNAIVFPTNPIDEVYTATFNLVALEPVIKEKASAVERFLKALKRAEAYTQKNPEDVQRLLSDQLQLDMEYLASTWGDSDFTLSLDQALLIGMEDEARWRIDNNLTSSKDIPDFLTIIHTDSLQKVSPRSVKIIDLR